MANPLAAPLASHLAHLLNAPEDDGVVRASAWRLWLDLLKTLAHGRGRLYAQSLIGVGLLGLDAARPDDREQAAETWMERVLNRPLSLHPGADRHKAHELLLALMRRGAGFPPPSLGRLGREAAPERLGAGGVRGALDRLRRLREGRQEAETPPSRRTRSDGPLILTLGDAEGAVPDDLSLWEALQCVPAEMHPLNGEALRRSAHLLVRAVETADEPWCKLMRLGLSPVDWAGVVSVNQAKTLGAFMTALREETAARASTAPDASALEASALEAAWARRKPTGFADLHVFLGSELGRALLSDRAALRQVDVEDFDPPAPEEDRLATPEEIEDFLKAAGDRALLTEAEIAALRRLAQGAGLPDLDTFSADHPDSLIDRVLEAARRLEETLQ